YIDDIIIFSKNENEHKEHLEKFLAIVKAGLVLSPIKTKIVVNEIEFLGAVIRKKKINYIPNLGVLLGPSYQKTSPHEDKRLKDHDWELIRKIKDLVPDLKIPLSNTYIVLETDDCMEGWGRVCKWKMTKNDPRSSER
ncbi:uncharacterized protein LOC110036529, partial [Phalaenopsis equestris]|uniref:uncharacterized protein LOC110036529 n=1 Tax=Phalaenopsis equestris TaxID=78828 RepID=UPI0009E2AEDC